MIGKLRQLTPLSVRQKIGPVVSYILYWLRLSFGITKPDVKILNIIDTLDLIYKNDLSIIRYGDGEITLIDGGDLLFQKHTPELAERLKNIFKYEHPQLLICATNIWNNLDDFVPYARIFNMHQAYRMWPIWKNILTSGRTYGETNITRHYLAYKDRSKASDIFKMIFRLWEKKDIVLIEGKKSRLGVGNDLFNGAHSIGRILCPAENAYSVYENILAEAKKIPKDTLILLSLGPTAKLLAYDLFKSGYRVLDIGHIDMEYEMYLQQSSQQVKVRYKYFNEIHERDPEQCYDSKYLTQIIALIE